MIQCANVTTNSTFWPVVRLSGSASCGIKLALFRLGGLMSTNFSVSSERVGQMGRLDGQTFSHFSNLDSHWVVDHGLFVHNGSKYVDVGQPIVRLICIRMDECVFTCPTYVSLMTPLARSDVCYSRSTLMIHAMFAVEHNGLQKVDKLGVENNEP